MLRRLRSRETTALLAAFAVLAVSACGRVVSAGSDSTGSRASLVVPAHTETWAYDDSPSPSTCDGGFGASATLVRQWLTFAETNCGSSDKKALRDCHTKGQRYCTVVQYLDVSKVWPSNPIRQAHSEESWWLHQPGHGGPDHRLMQALPGVGTAYWVDQANHNVEGWAQHFVRSHFGAWDGLMMDETGACPRTQFYGSGYRSSAEIKTTSGVQDEHVDLAGVLTHGIRTPYIEVDNGVQPNPYVCSGLPLLNDRVGVTGLLSEGNPWDNGFSSYYSDLLDVIAAVASRPHDFIVLLSYGQKGAAEARRVQEATVLLGYAPGHVVSWEDLEQQNNHLSVWPEEGIYPTSPIQSMTPPGGPGCLRGVGEVCTTGGHNDLRVAAGSNTTDAAAGVYRREFSLCYDRGIPFGPCAAIVNDTNRPVVVRASWLTLSYKHEITFSGGDVQSGGSLRLAGGSFTPGRTKIAANGAVLLSP